MQIWRYWISLVFFNYFHLQDSGPASIPRSLLSADLALLNCPSFFKSFYLQDIWPASISRSLLSAHYQIEITILHIQYHSNRIEFKDLLWYSWVADSIKFGWLLPASPFIISHFQDSVVGSIVVPSWRPIRPFVETLSSDLLWFLRDDLQDKGTCTRGRGKIKYWMQWLCRRRCPKSLDFFWSLHAHFQATVVGSGRINHDSFVLTYKTKAPARAAAEK